MKDFTKIDALKCPKLVRETILYLNGKVVDEATLKARSEDQIQILCCSTNRKRKRRKLFGAMKCA